MRKWLCIVSFGVLLSLIRLPSGKVEAQENGLAKYAGQVVQDVQVTCLSSAELEKLVRQNITVQVGERFSQASIRESIRKIYALKRFSQVIVEAELAANGVRLAFCPVQIQTIAKIQITGNTAIAAVNIEKALELQIGDWFAAHQIPKVTQHVVKLYKDRGYPQIQVNIQTTGEPGSAGVTLLVNVQEGDPSRIGSVSFAGQTLFTEQELMDLAKFRPGVKLTPETVEQGIARIKAAYGKKYYFDLMVAEQTIQYNQETGAADIRLTLMEGKPTTLRFEGNTQIPGEKLSRLLNITSSQNLQKNILERHVQTLLDFYQDQGFPFVSAISARTDEERGSSVVFTIVEGARIAVQRIAFEGNSAFSSQQLREHMLTTTKGTFAKGWYRAKVFQEDLLAIAALYRQQGYLEVAIPAVSKQFALDQQQVELTIAIEEGVQTRVADMLIVGESDEKVLKNIYKAALLKPGEPFNVANVTATVDQIKEIYAEKGYINAVVNVTPELNADKTAMSITFHLAPGQQFFVGKIFIQGVVRTKQQFVLRELRLKEGDLYRPRKIRETVRGLLQLGIYESVTFRRLDAKSENSSQDMLLEVRETSTKDVEFGFGYSTVHGLKGVVEYADQNFFNYGGRGSARTELSLERPKITLQYVQPNLLLHDTQLIASLFNEIQRDNATFDLEQRGGRLTVRHQFDPTLSLGVGYYFEQIDPSNVKAPAKLSALDTAVINLSGFDLNFAWDFRDDLIVPKKGGVVELYLRSSNEFLGAETDFWETQFRTTGYWRVFSQTVLAGSLNARMIEPFQDAESVPVYARYFWGGDNTLRGFKKHEVGPRGIDENGKVVNIGGDRLIGGNVELRFPIYSAFGGVLFYDTGANWLHSNGFDADLIRDTVGAGLRIATPIGPLRFDYGWKLDRQTGESQSEYYITIGSAF